MQSKAHIMVSVAVYALLQDREVQWLVFKILTLNSIGRVRHLALRSPLFVAYCVVSDYNSIIISHVG
jgi:hypothetical protein